MARTESTLRACRGCGPQYEATEQQIDRILQAPMFQNPEITVAAAIYEERLASCNSCEHLLQKMTCQLCGCYVRVSAKYRTKSCPNVKDRKWTAVN